MDERPRGAGELSSQATRIAPGLTWLGIGAPIQLDNQPPPEAAEITNALIDSMLASELKALKSESSP